MKPSLPRIYVWNDPSDAEILRRPATPIDAADITSGRYQDLTQAMLRVMKKANGIGLAAPQIGQSIRLAVIDRQVTADHQPLVLFNPVITSTSQDQESGEEGCLSIPGVFGLVLRSRTIRISALDAAGHMQSFEAHDLLARVLQHEIDHLIGKLFIDRATSITQGKDRL